MHVFEKFGLNPTFMVWMQYGPYYMGWKPYIPKDSQDHNFVRILTIWTQNVKKYWGWIKMLCPSSKTGNKMLILNAKSE